MRWNPRDHGGESRAGEMVKRQDWREREMIRQLSEKLYGRLRSGKTTP
ncbi:hypothetical protein IG197_11540 [Aminobacter sp. SR38]|jgi:hypothetical protein|nr:hypothetical protein [Aminobacter sp. SR38]QOF73634.1 hypothetical protein IG197_11540 [Aminobacter sp. SR38]